MMAAIERALARWLRGRGWIVFWLDEEHRACRAVCWMEEYKRSQEMERMAPVGCEDPKSEKKPAGMARPEEGAPR